MPTLPSKQLLSISQAAKFLKVHSQTLRRWEQQGILTPLRTRGKQRRYSLDRLIEFKTGNLSLTKPQPLKHFTVSQAAKILNLHPQTLRRWEISGKLIPFRSQGKQRRYTSEQLRSLTPKTQFPPPITSSEQLVQIVKLTSPTSKSKISPLLAPPTIEENLSIIKQIYQQPEIPWGKYALATFIIFLLGGFSFLGVSISRQGGFSLLGTLSTTPTPNNSSSSLGGQVLQAATSFIPTNFVVNLPAIFRGKVNIGGALVANSVDVATGSITTGSITTATIGTGKVTGDLAIGGGDLTTSATTFNLLNTIATTLNVGGAATTVSLGGTSGTTTINNDLKVVGATTVGGKLVGSGALEIASDSVLKGALELSGKLTAGGAATITGATVLSSTLTVSGLTTLTGNLDANGTTNDIAGTLNLSGNALTSGGDLTITPAGGDLILADGVTLNIGGSATDVAYNAIGDSFTTASLNVASDDDLYVEGNLEVDGIIYGNISGTVTSSLNPGSVVFAGVGGTLSEDATNFYWDNADNQLGIGTNDPGTGVALAVAGGNLTISSTYSILPTTNLGSDLGSALLRFNNLYVGTINSNATLDHAGQALFTYEPVDSDYHQSSVMINPTSPIANGWLLGFGVGGYQHGGIDEDGNLSLSYVGNTTTPSTDNPLTIYNNGTTVIATLEATGDFGLGDATPDDRLDIEDSALGYNFTFGSSGVVFSTATSDPITMASSGDISLSAGTGFSYASGLTVDATNGYVGIGTANPVALLDIQGRSTGHTAIGVLSDSTIWGAIGFQSTLTSTNYALTGNTTATYLNTPSGTPLALRVGNVAKMTIDSTGNVGIADSSPDDKLDIEDANLGYNFLFGSNGITFSTSGTSGINVDTFGQLSLTTNQGAASALELVSTAGGIDISAGSSTGDIDILSGDAINLKSVGGDISLSAGSLSYASGLTVDATNGYVGVGIASPTHMFHTYGDIRSTDIITAQNLLASANINTPYGGIGTYENKLKYSEELDNSGYWTYTVSSVTANATTAPDGTSTADKLVETAESGQHRVQKGSLTLSTTNPSTISIFAKAAEREYAYIFLWNATDTFYALASVNLTTGAIVTHKGTVNVESYPNGWYRISVSGTPTVAAQNMAMFYISTDGTTLSYLGDGSSGVYYWGAQVEGNSTVGPYTRTTTSTIAANTGLILNHNGFFQNNLGIGDSTPDDVLDIENSSLGYDFLFGSSGITFSTSGTSGINLDTLGSASITSNQGAANAVELISTAGGIDLSTGSSTQDIDILSGDAINLKAGTNGINFSAGTSTAQNGFSINAEGSVTLYGISSSSSTTEGTIYYDTDVDKLFVYAGGAFARLATDMTKFSGTNASVANGSYLEVVHSQNTSDLLSNGWIYDTATSQWKSINETEQAIDSGDGSDGAVAITASKNLNTVSLGADSDDNSTYADGIAFRVDAPADSATSVGRYTGESWTFTDKIVAGDEVLIINLQGVSGDVADVGNYEFMNVQSVTDTAVTFTGAITKSYNGTTAADQKVIIQRIPQYTTVTLSSSGVITASAWDALATGPTGNAGYLTGIVAFRATGTVTINYGTSITTSSLGYQGGTGGSAGANGGNNGESYEGSNGRGGSGSSHGETNGGGKSSNGATASPNNGAVRGGGGGGGSSGTACGDFCGGGGGGGAGYGGGGGGGGGARVAGGGGAGGTGGASNTVGGGGGGASYGAGGNAGSAGASGTGTGGEVGSSTTSGSGGGGANNTGSGGAGGGSGAFYGTDNLSTLFHGSGGGGGGGATVSSTAGGNGGKGGGIIFIATNTLTVSGTISSTGAAGAAGGTAGGMGAAGAGGSIYISANSASLGSSLITATGGAGVAASFGGGSGAGGVGRIFTEYSNFLLGSTSPATATTKHGNYQIVQTDVNTVRLYNYSGSTQNLRLDVTTFGADLAEWYPVTPQASDELPESGDVVSFTDNTDSQGIPMIRKGVSSDGSKLAGIISTHAGQALGLPGDNRRLLALAGRIPVKVDPLSPAIAVGDPLTASSVPGLAAKAKLGDQVIAKAIESWNSASSDPTVMVLVGSTGYSLGTLTDSGFLDQPLPESFWTDLDNQVASLTVESPVSGETSPLNPLTSEAASSAEATPSSNLSLVSLLTKPSSLIDLLKDLVTRQRSTDTKLVDLQSLVATSSASIETASGSGSLASFNHRLSLLEESILGTADSSISALLASSDASTSALYDLQHTPYSPGQDLNIDGSLTLTGSAFLNTLSTSGLTTIGTLSIDPATSSINSLAEPLRLQDLKLQPIEIMANSIVIDPTGSIKLASGDISIESGKIIGNSTFMDTATASAFLRSFRVNKDWDATPSAINLTPTFNSYSWVTDLDQTGFTINLSQPPSENKNIYWFALWK